MERIPKKILDEIKSWGLEEEKQKTLESEMNNYFAIRQERIELIKADQQYKSMPQPDYSKMSNDLIKKRTKMLVYMSEMKNNNSQ
jgi:hypothetical protein